MSVLLNFGSNLRKLCSTRKSIAQVCRDLDINRVQFNRYLTSHSFPKPHVLEKICDYFGVDCRIYIELLTDQQVDILKRGDELRKAKLEASYLATAGNFMDEGSCLTVSQQVIPDGIHQIWLNSFGDEEKAVSNLIYVSTMEDVRLVEGGDPVFGTSRPSKRFRGTLVGTNDGYSILSLSRGAKKTFGFSHFDKAVKTEQLLVGYSVLGRGEQTGLHRMTRSVFSVLLQDKSSILKAARETKKSHTFETIPKSIRDYLRLPVA